MAKRKLSKQQQTRISEDIRKRKTLLTKKTSDHSLQKGLVITRHGKSLIVETSNGDLFHCHIRPTIGDPVCGDHVAWKDCGNKQGVIEAIIERGTLLTRTTASQRTKPLAANINQMVIVCAISPPIDDLLIDKYLVAAEHNSISAVLVINKIDLFSAISESATRQLMSIYENIGCRLLYTSAKINAGVDVLSEQLKDRASILVGQSGVGKSSLINTLLPDQKARVGALVKLHGFGAHTTSTTTLFHLPQGGDLIDSPGVRNYRLHQLTHKQITDGYREINHLAGQCKFRNCSHINEQNCAVISAVSHGDIAKRRYENFLKLCIESTDQA